MIAALYVETGGAYYGLDDVDPWDVDRDARLYPGPWPVVAHPPCQTWCMLAPLVAHNTGRPVGDDGGTFAAALAAVRRFGGVLEHPGGSYAWSRFGLPAPARHGWAGALDDPGWSTEVHQVAYGHGARKRTWLYAVGVDLVALDYSSPPATRAVGTGHPARGPGAYSGRLRGKPASRTPPAFRDVLLGLARSARVSTP